MPTRAKLLSAANAAILITALALTAWLSNAAQWRPISLSLLLLALATASDVIGFRAKRMRISGAFLTIVLASILLGPAPSVAIGLACTVIEDARSRTRLVYRLDNLAIYAAFPLAGGLLIESLITRHELSAGGPALALLIFGVFLLCLAINFLMAATCLAVRLGVPFREQVRTELLPLLPSELASALVVVGIAFVYIKIGIAALALLGVVLFTFQYLLGALLVSQERAEELEQRSTQLASLQVGVLTAMIQTLSLRDHMTARHSAAVARYAREIAKAAGCSEEEQDLVHTAGILHDIGKFIFPDSILFADRRLSDEDWEIVKRHPAQGAKVVRQVDGYGPVADIILCHHERIDGGGYPRGLSGEEIPQLARMISIADTYDTMTARESYRRPVSPAEAIAELKRVSGSQLDAELVKVFIEVLASKGVRFQHADDADFEAELAFERRVKRHAQPRAA